MAAAAPEPSQSLDLDRTREIFEASRDFTIGLEEEFALVDPASLELVHRYPGAQTIIAATRGPGTLVVEHVGPAAAARYAVGQDLAQIPEIGEAADAAGRTGLTTLSAPVAQPDGSHEMFLVQPVVGDDRWFVSRVALAPLLEQVATQTQATDDTITLTDVTTKEKLDNQRDVVIRGRHRLDDVGLRNRAFPKQPIFHQPILPGGKHVRPDVDLVRGVPNNWDHCLKLTSGRDSGPTRAGTMALGHPGPIRGVVAQP